MENDGKVITKEMVASAIEGAIGPLACNLGCDICAGLVRAFETETNASAKSALDLLLKNAQVASAEHLPICQDTGYVWVCLEIGPDINIAGDVFDGVQAAVACAYDTHGLRKSMVHDALTNRTNTQDNTPAVCEIRGCNVPGTAKLHIMLKGGGSDNASRVVMLAPGAGRAGIKQALLDCVIEKGANACPPLTIGIGIGSTFDTVAGLAKHALLRKVGTPASNPEIAAFEAELLQAVNATGLGAAGLGGNNTALSVAIETAPCHIAALPVAINLGCVALRRTTIDLFDESTPSKAEATFADISATCATTSDTKPIELTLPLSKDALAQLRAGQAVELSGDMYTLRDAGHMRLLEEMRGTTTDTLPYNLNGQTIFYAGPTPAPVNPPADNPDKPFGAIGPTTSSRMDFAAPELYDAGIVATIGKGKRAPEIASAGKRNGAVYFTAVGGAAAYLANCVTTSTLVAYEDLGPEALRRIHVEKLPVIVATDATGASIYD